MTLDEEDVEAIAQRVAELLREPAPGTMRYVDAAALARTLGVEREWIYAHAAQLGALRLGGPHGRLRFDLEHVRSTLGDPTDDQAAGRRALRVSAQRRGHRSRLDRRATSS